MNTDEYFLKNMMEQYVDSNSLEELLSLVEEICQEKASHVLENWQDKGLAKQWEHRAKTIGSCQNKIKSILVC